MLRRTLPVCPLASLALFALATASLQAQSVPAPASPAADNARLPVRRVVLYKNGLGYFEHLGTVRDNQQVTIELTSPQLDDALKSLTVLDLGGGRVAGVSYDSDAPIARRLGALGLPIGQRAQLADVLEALRGSPLEVTVGGVSVAGRLLSVERRRATRGERDIEVDDLLLLEPAGTIRRLELTPDAGVRIADPDLAGRVAEYLRLVASSRGRDVRRLTIRTAGTGERPLAVSYISEAPVWKTTYRLVLPAGPGEKPLLQGWALVDNTVGEDWEDVRLSLVAGAPQSFIQRLSQPYYTRRPIVPLPAHVLPHPQTHQGAVTRREAADAALEGVPGGVVGGLVGGVPEPPPSPSAPGDRRGMEPAAQARELGELFEYEVTGPVTIRRNESALVPILQAAVAAEKVSIWNPSSGAWPRRGVWLTNESGLTLDAGSFTVLEQGAFAGEGLIASLRPGERRLLSYAADTAVLVNARQEPGPAHFVRIRVQTGIMTLRSERRERRTYTVRNEDTSPRVLVIEHAARPGWSLARGAEPDERSADWLRFRLSVEPKQTQTLLVDEVQPVENELMIRDLSDDQLRFLLQAQGLEMSEAIERALEPVLALRRQIAAVEADIASRESAIRALFEDQARLRENMKALKGSAVERALLRRYAGQLDEQESRLAVLREEARALARQRGELHESLDRLIDSLDMELAE